MSTRARPRDRRLLTAHLAFLAAIVVHGADHVRQGVDTVTPQVFWGGMLLGLLAFAALPFTFTGHPRAPLVAGVVGLWSALAVSASHLLPHWSAFSAPYPGNGLDLWSWLAVLAEIAAALVFGLLGLSDLRRHAAGGRVAAGLTRGALGA